MLQENYRKYKNEHNNYNGVLNYYTDNLTPYKMLEKSRQDIYNNYYDKDYQLKLGKEIENKMQIILQKSLDDIIDVLNIDITT